MTYVLDGGEVGSLVNQAIDGPIRKGWHEAMKLTDFFDSQIKSIVDGTITPKELRKLRGSKIIVPLGDGQTLTMTSENFLVSLLNTGNEGNLKSLKQFTIDALGNTLTDAHVAQLWNMATPEQAKFVQAIWDFLDKEMYPLLNELEKRSTGLPLKKVIAKEIVTPYGVLRGGYFPHVFDKEMSDKAAGQQERTANRNLSTGVHLPKQIKSSATHERVGTTYKDMVPLLNLSVLSNSINENIHDLCFREPVRDVQKLIHHPMVKDAISSSLGKYHWAQFSTWLEDIASPGRNVLIDKWEALGSKPVIKAGNFLRNNIVIATLGFKAAVVFCQVTGFTQSVQLLGAKHFAAGVKSYFGNWGKAKAFIFNSSIEMKNRNKNSYDRDIADTVKTDNAFFKDSKEQIVKATFWPIAQVDQVLANCIWQGAYLRALEEGKNHDGAVAYADAIVRMTQPTGSLIDQSHVMRGMSLGGLGKMFTMYGTFFSGTHSLGWAEGVLAKQDWKKGKQGKAIKRVSRAALMLYLLPAIIEALIREEWPDDEYGWDEWLEDVGKGVIGFAVAGIPLVKDLVNFKMGSSPKFKPTPIQDAIETFAGVDKAVQNVDEKSGQNRLIKALGFTTGLPTGQALVTKAGLEEWDDDESTAENLWHLLIRRPWEK